MSRRKLPLESPDWWPIIEAVAHLSQRRDSDKLAAQDVHQRLKTGELPSLLQHVDGRREQLTPSAWEDDFYFVLYPGGGPPRSRITVSSRKLGTGLPGCRFFVWKPDYEKIFDLATAPVQSRTKSQEMPIKRGRKEIHDRADLQSVALGLALKRKQGAPEKKPTDVVDELRLWCTRNKRKVPADSTLYDIVAAAFRIKPTLKS